MNNQEVLLNRIKKDLDVEALTLEPIDKGLMNKIFIIKTSRDNFILRCDTAEQSRYPLEAWVMDEVRKLGIPTPRCIKADVIKTNEKEKINYMIQEKLHGRALNDDFPANIDTILEQTGAKLKLMHKIELKRFGHLTPERVGVVRSWPEFMFYHFKSSNSDYLEEIDFLTAKELDKATYLINERISNFNIKQGYMLHIDLSLDHIFHHNHELEGIIDFQNVGAGDPLYDIATFEFYSETKYRDKRYSSPLRVGYELKSVNNVTEAITFYKLCLGIWKITKRMKSKREKTVPRVKELIRYYISELS